MSEDRLRTPNTPPSESTLSHEARQAIRDYLLKLMALPAIVVALLSFVLGYFINQGAQLAGISKALDVVQTILPKLNESANSAAVASEKSKLNAANAEESVKKASADVEVLEKGLKDLDQLRAALKDKDQLSAEITRQVLDDQKFKDQLSEAVTKSFQAIFPQKVRIYAGTTGVGRTDWKAAGTYAGPGVMTSVPVSIPKEAGFKYPPLYFVNISGGGGQEAVTGASSYFNTDNGFDVFLHLPNGEATVKKATEAAWTVNWLAIVEPQ
jgi:hypothetical protein